MMVAGIQHDIVWERPEENFARLAPMIEHAAADGARLVVLTEMYATGFSMKTDRIAEPVGGPSARFLADQARAHDVWVCASVPERTVASEHPFNQLVLAAPDGSTSRYAKIHPFTYGREHEHYSAGGEFLTVEIDGVRCSFFVCYDLRFADEFWALAPRTDCYVVPANWPASRREHWTALLQARAIENQAYVVGVNRVGDGGRLHYSGDSLIVDPFGEIVARAADTETIITADVDAGRVRSVRSDYPFLQDRR
ncbi:MAG TPA: carbon-nitrogen family hydrolase [Acidimicrobiia bacterium]